jgi:hypothetical protein
MSRVLLLTVLLLGTPPLFLYPATLTNNHLLVTVDDDTGRLFMATQGGLEHVEGDKRRHLLFFDQPPASYTLIYLDDDLFIFGGEKGTFSKRPVVVGNYIETVWVNDLIRVTQVVQFVQREGTGFEDGIILRYEIENRMASNVEVGIRILLDTYLGEKTPFHFLFADGTQLEYETEFDDLYIPPAWESREENSEGPCLRGVLDGRLVTLPRKVVFANYRSLLEQPVLYRVMKNRRFHNLPYSRNDSAVALYFGPEILEPGDTAEFSTILGLCGEGEYALGGHEVIFQEKTVLPPPKTGPLAAANREEIEQLLKDIGDIESMRNSMDRINALIAELNKALESEDVAISEERLAEIRRALHEMTE